MSPQIEITPERVRELLALDGHAQSIRSHDGTSAGWRVWPSTKHANQVYVESVRSSNKFDYTSSQKSVDDRLKAYARTLRQAGCETQPQLVAGHARLQVNAASDVVKPNTLRETAPRR
jgi:hypothetical protein